MAPWCYCSTMDLQKQYCLDSHCRLQQHGPVTLLTLVAAVHMLLYFVFFFRSSSITTVIMAGLRFLSLNCHGLSDDVVSYLHSIISEFDFVLLQETWLSN